MSQGADTPQVFGVDTLLEHLAGRGLSSTAKLAALQIATFGDRGLWSLAHLMRHLEIKRSTAFKALRDLEIAGVLVREVRADPLTRAQLRTVWRLKPWAAVSPRAVPAKASKPAASGHLEVTGHGSESDPCGPEGSVSDPSSREGSENDRAIVAPPEPAPVQKDGPPPSGKPDPYKQESEKQELGEIQAARAELAAALGDLPADPVAALSSTDEATESSSPAVARSPIDACTFGSESRYSRASDGGRRAALPGLAKAPGIATATAEALTARFGATAVLALRGVLRTRKWARPGLAELACHILMERRNARDPHLYIHRLWDEADKRLDLAAEGAEARTHDYVDQSRAPPPRLPPGPVSARPLTRQARDAAARFAAQDFAGLRAPS